MNDFLDREPELGLREEIAELAARHMLTQLKDNYEYRKICEFEFENEIYRAPEFRNA